MRDQNTFEESLRKKRLMTLVHLWLVHRYKSDVGALRHPQRGQPVPDHEDEIARPFLRGQTEVGQIIVADVNHPRIEELLAPDRVALWRLIRKEG